jgi:predicted nucleotidyltransferase
MLGERKSRKVISMFLWSFRNKGLLAMVRIERELSEFLGVKVDLLTEESISPYLIDRIKKEAKIIST